MDPLQLVVVVIGRLEGRVDAMAAELRGLAERLAMVEHAVARDTSRRRAVAGVATSAVAAAVSALVAVLVRMHS